MIKFDRREIEDENLLFGRKDELEKLNKLIDQKTPVIVVSGFRRVGKSSLIRCAVKKRSSLIINAWDAGTKIPTRAQILDLFRRRIEGYLNEHKNGRSQLRDFIYSVSGFNFNIPGGAGVGLSFKDKTITEPTIISVLDALNQWAVENNQLFVLVIDEVQDFAHAKGIDLRKIFAKFFTPDYSNLVLILTGSEIGTLHDFVSKKNPRGPLFGRDSVVVHLSPFDENKSEQFLLTGLSDSGVPIIRTIPDDPTIEQAITELGGIAGWISIFGLKCIDKGTISLEALDEAKEDSSMLIEKEFCEFLEKYDDPEKYELVVSNLAKLNAYNFDEFIKEQKLEKYLIQLINSGFVHKIKKEEIYQFTDPLVAHYFRKRYVSI